MLGIQGLSHKDAAFARLTKALSQIDEQWEATRQEARDNASVAIELIRNYNKIYRDARSKKPTIYNVGDYVLIRDTTPQPGVNSKLKPAYKGPYVINKSLGSNRYVVRDIPGFNITARPLDTVLSSDRLKPWVKALPNTLD